MKSFTKLAGVFALSSLLAVSSMAQQQVTATLTVTGTPANGATLTVDGQVFTWTTSTPVGNFQMLVTNTVANDALNVFNVTGLVLPFYGATVTNTTGTAVVQFTGISLTASASAGWSTLTFSTNGTAPATNIWIPFINYASGDRTPIASQLIADLSSYSTTALDETMAVTSQLVGTNNNQVIGGNKTFVGTLNGTVGSLTNGGWLNASLTNGQNFGNPFRSPGTGSGSEQFGLNASATAGNAIAIGDNASASALFAIAIGNASTAQALGCLSFGYSASSQGLEAIAFGYNSQAVSSNATALGGQSYATAGATALGFNATANTGNATAIGQNSTTTQTNQIMLGVASGSVDVPGVLNLEKGMSNLITLTTSTNTLNGALVIPAVQNSSLANSNNAAVAIGTNSCVQLSGPSASFYIAGVAGGVAGRKVTLENTTPQIMVIGNQSGADPTAANRIITMTGADRVISNNVVTLWYDGAVNRWKIYGVN